MFRKIVACAAALALALTLCSAQAESVLTPLFDQAYSLLFQTDNVTLEGSLSFELDGTLFKRAEVGYQIDGTLARQTLALYTPRTDGTETASGYVVVVQGPLVTGYTLYDHCLTEFPFGPARSTIMSSSLQLESMLTVARAALEQAEEGLDGKLVVLAEKDGGTTVRIGFAEGDIPEVADAALTLLTQYALRLYNGIDHAEIDLDRATALENYITVMDGLLYGVRSMALGQGDLMVTTDAQGRLTGGQGSVDVTVTDWQGTRHTVRVTFDITASAYGATEVDLSAPEGFESVAETDDLIEIPSGDMTETFPGEANTLVTMTRGLFEQAGYELPADMLSSCLLEQTDRGLTECVVLHTEDNSLYLSASFDTAHQLLWMQDLDAFWLDTEEVQSSDKVTSDPDELARVRAFAREYLLQLRPDLADCADAMVVAWEARQDDVISLQLWDSEHGVSMVLRAEPELRVEYLSTFSNG